MLAGLALALAGGEGVATADLVTDVVRQFLLGGLLGFIGGSVISQLLLGSTSLTRGSMLPVVSLALLLVLFFKLWLLLELVKFLANSWKQGVEEILMLFNLLNT